jgi:fumarate reductase subunit D
MSTRVQNFLSTRTTQWPWWAGAALALTALACLLAWVASGFQDLASLWPFLAVLLAGAGILVAGWLVLSKEGFPGWLSGVLVAAALLRVAAGVAWYVALPQNGYNSEAELNGYVMADAYERDQAAWDLAKSGSPLWKAFTGYRKADQYGGILFLSAAVYRFAGGDTHQPLQMVILTAAFSSLAVLFTWAFCKRAWSTQVANLAAIGIALYPEAVLMGSSQTREAFTITLAAAAFYGLARFTQKKDRSGLWWVLGALLLNLAFSPPFTALLFGMLLLTAAFKTKAFTRGRILHQRRFWLALGVFLMLVLAGMWLTLSRLPHQEISNPVALVRWWLLKSAEWQSYITLHASGMIQKVFHSTPDWMHSPLLIAYGVVQPFLPAAIMDLRAAPVWSAISIWRSLGWAILLPFLIYAPLRALRTQNGGQGFALGLSLAIWASILIASFRGGGDAWDNPRYRAMFASLQIALVAWVWSEQRRASDPWPRRALISAGWVMLWFLPWYLRRRTPFEWPVIDVFQTLGLGLASAVLFILWDWTRTAPRQPEEQDEAGLDCL